MRVKTKTVMVEHMCRNAVLCFTCNGPIGSTWICLRRCHTDEPLNGLMQTQPCASQYVRTDLLISDSLSTLSYLFLLSNHTSPEEQEGSMHKSGMPVHRVLLEICEHVWIYTKSQGREDHLNCLHWLFLFPCTVYNKPWTVISQSITEGEGGLWCYPRTAALTPEVF